jgi:hypothetical protein
LAFLLLVLTSKGSFPPSRACSVLIATAGRQVTADCGLAAAALLVLFSPVNLYLVATLLSSVSRDTGGLQ